MPRLPEPSPLLKDDMPIYLYVAVTDTGPGLTPKELDMLFQRFSQVSREFRDILLEYSVWSSRGSVFGN